jgi:hypothetical protein
VLKICRMKRRRTLQMMKRSVKGGQVAFINGR